MKLMAVLKYYVKAVWKEPDDPVSVKTMIADNKGKGYNLSKAFDVVTKLMLEGKYCRVYAMEGGVKRCAVKSIKKSGKQTSS